MNSNESPCATAYSRFAYLGIDNGFTGAVSCLLPDNRVFARPVKFIDLGKEKLLDIEENRLMLREMIAAAGTTKDKVLVVYEQAQVMQKAGARNNFTNGKNGEFWRVLLTLEQIPFMWVNPKDWQKQMFRGVRGDDTKVMAALVRRQLFPEFDGSGHNRSQMEGINDAILIAACARENRK